MKMDTPMGGSPFSKDPTCLHFIQRFLNFSRTFISVERPQAVIKNKTSSEESNPKIDRRREPSAADEVVTAATFVAVAEVTVERPFNLAAVANVPVSMSSVTRPAIAPAASTDSA